jgi:peroxiredoxin
MNSKKALISILCFSLAVVLNAQSIPEDANDISPLLIGEKAPASTVTNLEGKTLDFAEVYSQKPTVLIVYRGGWCPYCNLHLAELQEIEQQLIDAGYQIVAVSPDAAENLRTVAGKNDLRYQLLSDSDLSLIKAMGLAYRAPERNHAMLKNASGGANPGLLPVPAVFLLDKEGVILFQYINPNYKVRISSELLLAAVTSLNRL